MDDQVVSLANLELIRAVLARVSTHMEATDLAASEAEISSVRYRPLTVAVAECASRVEGLIADFLLAEHLANQEELPGGDADHGEGDEQDDDLSGVHEDESSRTTEEPSQLTLFDPATYESPPAVQAARRKYGLLADE